MKHHYLAKNPELTSKALDFIYHCGRNKFDEMINSLLEQRIDPIKAGWITNHKEVKKIFKRRKKNG